MNTKDLVDQFNDKPYEKFRSKGAKALTDSELLAIILRTGTKDKDAVELSKEVLSLARFPREGLLGLYDVSIDELSSINGIGPVKAIKLKAITELAMRLHRACASVGFYATSPDTVADYFMEEMRHLENEVVIIVCLDAKGQMISHSRISEGTVNLSLVSPRSIFIEALKNRAVNFILLHNHPSGDPEPSKQDIEITGRICDLGNELEISLLDHIIIGDNRYYSFREHSYL